VPLQGLEDRRRRQLIELLDFNLRGGQEAPSAAARVARITERYLAPAGARDAMAVVNEIVAWVAEGDPAPQTLRLELSVTLSFVRVSVTATERAPHRRAPTSNRLLRQALPVTAALASRYGVEAGRRTRVWAELDRRETESPVYSESQYS
jgi:hypothetical protein